MLTSRKLNNEDKSYWTAAGAAFESSVESKEWNKLQRNNAEFMWPLDLLEVVVKHK